MKVENGKIVEVTENELFSLYLERGMDDVMKSEKHLCNCQCAGCRVVNDNV